MASTETAAAQVPLFGREDEPAFDASLTGLIRMPLDGTAWVDHLPGWVVAGHQTLFDALEAGVPWRSEERRMYDRTVPTPRLFAFHDDGTPAPHPAVDAMGQALSAHYGVPLDHRSYALYRNGRDSVAFHRDRELRDRPWSLVAIVTLGGPRTFRLRPVDPARRRGQETTRGFRVGWGDLLVMGGTCQRDWEHGVPKTAAAPPRMAVMFRHDLAAIDLTAARRGRSPAPGTPPAPQASPQLSRRRRPSRRVSPPGSDAPSLPFPAR